MVPHPEQRSKSVVRQGKTYQVTQDQLMFDMMINNEIRF